jgi:hypothetical protein
MWKHPCKLLQFHLHLCKQEDWDWDWDWDLLLEEGQEEQQLHQEWLQSVLPSYFQQHECSFQRERGQRAD